MQRSTRYQIVAILGLMVLLLSGCVKVRQEVTLKADENWQVVINVTFPKSTVDQIGQEQMTSTEEQFQTQKDDAAKKGVKADLKVRTESNGDVVYDITYEGTGLALLNETVFSNGATISAAENGRITFRYDPGDITSLTAMGGSYTFVLKAGKIYSSNATDVKGGTATWTDPSSALEAEVGTAGGGFPTWLLIVLIVVGVLLVVVVAAVLLYMRGKRVKAAPAAPPPPAPTSQPPTPMSQPPAPPSQPPAPTQP